MPFFFFQVTRRDDQSAISSNEDHVEYEATQTSLPVTYQHTAACAHLTGKRSQQRSQGPQRQQSTPSYCLLTTTFVWRSLTTGGTCIIQPSRPRGSSHSQCCCVAFPGAVIVITITSSSFSHACACNVYIHVCTCTYRNSINKCSTMIPTAVPWAFLFKVILLFV